MFKFNSCSNQIKYSILIYIISISIYILLRPSLTFNNNGSLKEFGVSNDKNNTIFPLWLVCFIFAIFAYYIIIFICSIKKKT